MPENTSLLGFVVAALIVLLIPGPGVLYIIARSLSLSLSQGLTAGLVSVLGLASGALVHIAAGNPRTLRNPTDIRDGLWCRQDSWRWLPHLSRCSNLVDPTPASGR